MDLGDSILFPGYNLSRQCEIAQRRRLPLSGTKYPSQDNDHRAPTVRLKLASLLMVYDAGIAAYKNKPRDGKNNPPTTPAM